MRKLIGVGTKAIHIGTVAIPRRDLKSMVWTRTGQALVAEVVPNGRRGQSLYGKVVVSMSEAEYDALAELWEAA